MSGPGGATSPTRSASLAAAFRYPAFAVIWTATLISDVGGWMYNAASGWLDCAKAGGELFHRAKTQPWLRFTALQSNPGAWDKRSTLAARMDTLKAPCCHLDFGKGGRITDE
jgi:hypothetical protein